MGLGKTLYNTFFRRTSAFFITVLVGAVLFERAFDQGGDRMWERMNQGVSGTVSSSHVPHVLQLELRFLINECVQIVAVSPAANVLLLSTSTTK